LFIAGVSMSFSLNKGLDNGLSKQALYKKVFIRMVLLILLGIIFKNSPLNIFEPSQIRYGSVLGRIGIACFAAAVLYLNYPIKIRLFWIAGILLSYYGILFLVPVPEYGAGDLSFEGNIVGWIDRLVMPGRLRDVTYDELAFFTQFPALCITVFGTIAGDILRNNDTGNKKTITLLSAGALAVAVALIWNLHFPIGKPLWSSSFIMLTSGLGFIILSIFYWIIDVKGYKKWAFFFKVIGMNSLTVYFAYSYISFRYTSRKIFSGLYAPLPEQWHEVLEALGAWALVWLFLYILYKKGLFLKI